MMVLNSRHAKQNHISKVDFHRTVLFPRKNFFFLTAQYDNQIDASLSHRPSQSKKVCVGVARQGRRRLYTQTLWLGNFAALAFVSGKAGEAATIFTLQGRVCPRPGY